MTQGKLQSKINIIKLKLRKGERSNSWYIGEESELHHDLDLLNSTLNQLTKLEQSLNSLKTFNFKF